MTRRAIDRLSEEVVNSALPNRVGEAFAFGSESRRAGAVPVEGEPSYRLAIVKSSSWKYSSSTFPGSLPAKLSMRSHLLSGETAKPLEVPTALTGNGSEQIHQERCKEQSACFRTVGDTRPICF